jgi:hypothetical protein
MHSAQVHPPNNSPLIFLHPSRGKNYKEVVLVPKSKHGEQNSGGLPDKSCVTTNKGGLICN